ncbi:MAG: YbbR-like domain-containing protein [Chloroflexota bacterium]
MKQLWERIVALAGSNLGLKALALIIAVGLWMAGHRDIERAIEVPLEFRNIPSDLMVMDNRVDYVVLRVMGPRTLVSTLNASDLKLALDLDGAKSGSLSYPLASGYFNVPRGVIIARITPPVLHIRLEPVARRTLPVSVRLSGKPLEGYRVAQTVARPASVMVQGPAEEVRRLTAIETIPIDIEGSRSTVGRRVRLSNDGKPLSIAPDQVDVAITVEEERVTRLFERVEVRALDFKGVYTVTPPTVSLKLSGPKSIIGPLKLAPEQVHLNLQGMAVGAHNVPVELNLPAGVEVAEQKPQRFRVRIIKRTE